MDEHTLNEGNNSESDILSYALKYSSSLWRKHDDSSCRTVSPAFVNGHTEEANNMLVSNSSGNIYSLLSS